MENQIQELNKKLDLILETLGYKYIPARYERTKDIIVESNDPMTPQATQEQLDALMPDGVKIPQYEPYTPALRTCKTCGETKPATRQSFFWINEGNNILTKHCIPCSRAKNRKYRGIPESDKEILEGMGIKTPKKEI